MTTNIDGKWKVLFDLVKENQIDEAEIFCKRLEENEYEILENRLIQELMATRKFMIRNTIANILSELKSNKAIDTMVKILNDKKIKNTATLVYALEELDCADRIAEIFHILYDGNYEAR